MNDNDALHDWADLAVERMFKDGVRTSFDSKEPEPCIILYEEGFQSPVILGQAASWPEAVSKTWAEWKDSSYVRTGPLPQRSKKPPEGEEYIEEFCQSMRQRDLLTEFLLWYGQKGDEDPEAYPRALCREGWLEQFGMFIEQLGL
jgi:hypothetical protein